MVQENNDNSAGDSILPAIPSFFKIARFKGIKDDKIHLEIDSTEVPTAVCGDGYSSNLKGSRLLESTYSLKSLFKMCFSHFLWENLKAMHVRKSMSSRCKKSLRESKKVVETLFNEPKK